MIQSHVIEVEGTFVGAAIRQPDGFRFVAVDVRLDELDGHVLATLDDVRRQARQVFIVGRRPLPALQAVAPCVV